ncbi:MAG: hypothetical protein ACQCN4_06175 [Candidatus Bathyarchaeia archaeon]
MSTPIVGRNGVVKKAGTAIGYAKGVSVSISVELIKDYAMESNKPAILEDGNQSYKVTVESMYVDNTYASLVLAGEPVDIELDPAGNAVGKPKLTVKNVVFTNWKLDQKQTGVVMQSMDGEGDNLEPATIEA